MPTVTLFSIKNRIIDHSPDPHLPKEVHLKCYLELKGRSVVLKDMPLKDLETLISRTLFNNGLESQILFHLFKNPQDEELWNAVQRMNTIMDKQVYLERDQLLRQIKNVLGEK